MYDSDTSRVDRSLGFNIWQLNKPLRLYGIDTPEVRGAERLQGLIMRDIVEQRLRQADRLIIETHKDTMGKYGRLVGTVHYCVDDQWRNLNQELLNEGLAVAYPE